MKPGPVRMKGALTSWNDERGFGFVTPVVGGADVFVHISAFSEAGRRPVRGDEVAYELEFSRDGRPRASRAELTASRAVAVEQTRAPRVFTPSHRAGALGYLAVAGFVGIVVIVARFILALPVWVAVLYLGLSAVTFLAYALDKRAAASSGWRIAEGSLLALGLAGGWPGAIVAQQLFRHKTVKVSFQVIFWVTVLVNVVAFVVFSWVASITI